MNILHFNMTTWRFYILRRNWHFTNSHSCRGWRSFYKLDFSNLPPPFACKVPVIFGHNAKQSKFEYLSKLYSSVFSPPSNVVYNSITMNSIDLLCRSLLIWCWKFPNPHKKFRYDDFFLKLEAFFLGLAGLLYQKICSLSLPPQWSEENERPKSECLEHLRIPKMCISSLF